MFKDQERRQFAQPAVPQQDRNVFQAKYQEVAGNAERDFREHRMRVGMPEGEPRPQRLAYIDHQDGNRAAVADEAHNHGGVQNRP
jgi:hypothetical protein